MRAGYLINFIPNIIAPNSKRFTNYQLNKGPPSAGQITWLHHFKSLVHVFCVMTANSRRHWRPTSWRHQCPEVQMWNCWVCLVVKLPSLSRTSTTGVMCKKGCACCSWWQKTTSTPSSELAEITDLTPTCSCCEREGKKAPHVCRVCFISVHLGEELGQTALQIVWLSWPKKKKKCCMSEPCTATDRMCTDAWRKQSLCNGRSWGHSDHSRSNIIISHTTNKTNIKPADVHVCRSHRFVQK